VSSDTTRVEFSINETKRRDITGLSLKVALNTINLTLHKSAAGEKIIKNKEHQLRQECII